LLSIVRFLNKFYHALGVCSSHLEFPHTIEIST